MDICWHHILSSPPCRIPHAEIESNTIDVIQLLEQFKMFMLRRAPRGYYNHLYSFL